MPINPFRNATNFNSEVGAGNVPGFTNGVLFGLSLEIPSLPADIWHGGGIYTGQPTSNLSDFIEIFSSESGDALNGDGAHAYIIQGLKNVNSCFIESETVLAHPTDGQLSVFSSEKWYRMSLNIVPIAGANEGALGEITLRHQSVVANVFSVIPTGFNRSQLGAFTVPCNNELTQDNGLLSMRRTGGNLSGSVVVTARARPPGGVYQAIFTLPVVSGGPVPFTFDDIGELPAGTDIKFSVLEISNTDIIAIVSSTFTLRQTA